MTDTHQGWSTPHRISTDEETPTHPLPTPREVPPNPRPTGHASPPAHIVDPPGAGLKALQPLRGRAPLEP